MDILYKNYHVFDLILLLFGLLGLLIWIYFCILRYFLHFSDSFIIFINIISLNFFIWLFV